MDVAAFHGVWRLKSLTAGGHPVITGQTHLVVRPGVLWEVWPTSRYYEDEPGPECAYEFETAGDIGRLTVRMPRGPARCGLVRIEGATMRIRWGGVAGRHAASLEDEAGTLATYARAGGAEAAQHADPPPRRTRLRIAHPVLGELLRNDNLRWWEGTVAWGGQDGVKLHVDAPADVSTGDLDRVADLLQRVRAEDLRRYAAAQLLDLRNDSWREEGEAAIDAAAFASRLTPESFGAHEDGSVSVFFDDGDLFRGHVVIVSLDSDLSPEGAQIAG